MDTKWDSLQEVFYDFPSKQFTIRELAKLAKIPKSTVQKYLGELKKMGWVTRENQANNTELSFKLRKIHHYVEKIADSGVIEELVERLNPSVIILFGSIRKGESEKESDIDLFVETAVKKEVDLSKYKKKLGREIQLFVYPEMAKLPAPLFNNVVNGIKLYGSFAIK